MKPYSILKLFKISDLFSETVFLSLLSMLSAFYFHEFTNFVGKSRLLTDTLQSKSDGTFYFSLCGIRGTGKYPWLTVSTITKERSTCCHRHSLSEVVYSIFSFSRDTIPCCTDSQQMAPREEERVRAIL